MASHFKQSYVDDHDYEAAASPMAAESITKLHTGEGARKFASTKKREKAKLSRGALIGIAIAALLVIVGGFFIVRGVLNSPMFASEGDLASDSLDLEPQQVEVSVDADSGAVDAGAIEYMGETYSMVALEGTAAVVEIDENGTQRSLFVLPGKPATMFLYDGTLLVPENLADGWDVIAYMVGAESQASPIVGEDGQPVKGSGEITDAHLEGSDLVVTDSTGATTRIAL